MLFTAPCSSLCAWPLLSSANHPHSQTLLTVGWAPLRLPSPGPHLGFAMGWGSLWFFEGAGQSWMHLSPGASPCGPPQRVPEHRATTLCLDLNVLFLMTTRGGLMGCRTDQPRALLWVSVLTRQRCCMCFASSPGAFQFVPMHPCSAFCMSLEPSFCRYPWSCFPLLL